MEPETLESVPIAEIEVTYKSKIKTSLRPIIKSSQDMYELLLQLWNKDTISMIEEFKVIYLNRANRILGIYTVSKGGITGTVADPRLVFAVGLKLCSCLIVLCHNHPSGNLQPSRFDDALTEKFKIAGQILEIKVLDHLIISAEGYYSFSDEGAL